MVCTRNDLSAWKDFPKGLKVLLLDEDSNSAAEIRSKLESMDYTVYTFCNENEAISAVSSRLESFHVAIVEVSTNDNDGHFKFLEAAKDLPTIMTSNIHCISTMMKCIALGAVEFLRKPLSEDKLRNIWQHVVHKAFSAGENDLSESLKPVKDSVVSMLSEDGEHKHEDLNKIEDAYMIHENNHEPSASSNKYPAPSTPQLEHGGRLLVNGDCQEHTNCSTEKESGEPDGESKSVETTSGNTIAEVTAPVDQHQGPMETMVKEEDDLVDGTKDEHTIDSHPQDIVNTKDSDTVSEKPNTVYGVRSSLHKANRTKSKVDWTTELHKKFVHAVDQFGIDQAIPSRILELMKVEDLTRHNVASHLQKYRMHKRHVLPKGDNRGWPQRDRTQRGCYPHKPIMALPPYQSNHVVPVAPLYPMWRAPHPASVQTWGSQGYYPWQPSWHWKPYPGLQADAWGCPVMTVPQGNCSTFTQNMQNAYGFHCSSTMDNRSGMPRNSVEHQPAEEVIDEVVKEAINKPWLPLPLGLKPPSTDCVLAELSRQGIRTVPPHNQRL